MVFLWVVPAILVALVTFIFSYFWLDYAVGVYIANGHPILNKLIEALTYTSLNHRLVWANYYLVIIFLLFALQILYFRLADKIALKPLFITAAACTLLFSLSYPILSDDIFTYLFSAKMVWFYHLNPYTVKPIIFLGHDFETNFLRNIDLTYAYGQVFLAYSMIPIIIFSAYRFVFTFFGLKLMNAILFFLAGLAIFKVTGKNRKVFSLWFFNPLLIVELLINSHNGIVMICLFVISIYFLEKRKFTWAWISFWASVFIKYVSIIATPVLLLNPKWRIRLFYFLSLGLPIYLQVQPRALQIWYFDWVYMFLPFIKLKTISWILIYLMGIILLIHYYPFLQTGQYNEPSAIPEAMLWFNLIFAIVVFVEL